MPPAKTEQARWFAEEVHPHEPTLKAYLRGAFPSVRDVDDVVQESYLRVWRARAVQPITLAKAFLFKVARHVALDLVRRARVAPIDPVGDMEQLCVIDDMAGAAEIIETNERIAFLADALDALPPRCREVMILCKLQGASYREAATQLGLSEKPSPSISIAVCNDSARNSRSAGCANFDREEAGPISTFAG